MHTGCAKKFDLRSESLSTKCIFSFFLSSPFLFVYIQSCYCHERRRRTTHRSAHIFIQRYLMLSLRLPFLFGPSPFPSSLSSSFFSLFTTDGPSSLPHFLPLPLSERERERSKVPPQTTLRQLRKREKKERTAAPLFFGQLRAPQAGSLSLGYSTHPQIWPGPAL